MKKLSLAQLPTPIQPIHLPTLKTEKQLFIKRDDYTGTECSGNKIRKLEYCLQEALDQGAEDIITSGALQSNHCRATAAACARLGLRCHLVLKGNPTQPLEGNLFLDQLFGSSLYLVSEEAGLKAKVSELAHKLSKKGPAPYLIPMGASNATGSQGYVDCYEEIIEQEKKLNRRFDTIVVAVGSGGTYAGLWQANQRQADPRTLIGFSVLYPSHEIKPIIEKIIHQMPPHPATINDILVIDSYIGLGYGKYTPAELTFYVEVAHQTGIVLDPTYTGKAFRGLCQEINDLPGENILFIHTGGLMGWTQEMRNSLFPPR